MSNNDSPVVAYVQYVVSDSETDTYSYYTFPDAVCCITINGLAETFKVSNADMGVIIISLKHVFNKMFHNVLFAEVIVTDELIDINDIQEEYITDTRNMEKTFLSIFDAMLIAVTKQCRDTGVQEDNVIFKHTIQLYNEFCLNVIKRKINLHYIDLELLDVSIGCIISNVVSNKKKELSDMLIMLSKKNGENIIKMKSFQPMKFANVCYVDKSNKMKLAKKKLNDKYYTININANSCSCPDFIYRKMKVGLSCKHLMELKNKTRCLMLIKNIPALYNIAIPIKEMLETAYSPGVRY
jgi:predicted nucleic acid-binding Zn finger protein